MKAFIFTSLFIYLISLSINASEFILTPLSERGKKEILLVKTCAEVMNVTPVFSISERKYLKSQDILSGASVLVKVSNYDQFKLWAKARLIQVEIKQNFVVEATSEYDPLFKEQWGLENRGDNQEIDISDIHVIELRGKIGSDLGLNGVPVEKDSDIVVAILDTGIDYTHPDLKKVIHRSKKECDALLKYEQCLVESSVTICDKKWATHDADGNGYPLDCAGWNVLGNGNPLSPVKGSNDASDSIGHGTHIAGIIAAEKNGVGIEGVARQVKILPVKVMGDVKAATSDDLPSNQEQDLAPIATYADIFARGLLYAIRSDVDIINMSLGWSRSVDSVLMRDLVKLAISKKIVIVAAAGNDSTAHPIYPCIYDGVICVGAFSADGTMSHFSNFGSSVDISAPGQKIISSWPMKLTPTYFTERKGYEFKNGTSMSAPFIVGAIARLLNAGFSTTEAYARLMLGTNKDTEYVLDSGVSKFTLSGNANLKNSFEVTPRPLILPAKKGVNYLVWNGKDRELPLKITLQNFWVAGKNISIKLKVKNSKGDFTFAKSVFTFDKVDHLEKIEIDTMVMFSNNSIGSEFTVELLVTDGEGRTWTTYAGVEVVLPITDKRHHPQEITLSFKDKFKFSDELSIKSFVRIGSREELSYLIIKKIGRFSQLTLLKGKIDGQQAEILNSFEFKGRSENIAGQWQLDIDGNGTLEYVVVERILKSVRTRGTRSSKGSSNQLKFYFFNSDFSPRTVQLLGQNSNVITYDNAHAVIGKDFRWIRNAGVLVPAWIGKGDDLSKLNQPINPWETDTALKGTFFYYFGSDKLESVAQQAKSKFKLINFIKQNTSPIGTTSVLYALGTGFKYEFFSQTFFDITELNEIAGTSLAFDNYFMLGGAENFSVLGQTAETSFMDINKSGGLYLGVWSEKLGSKLLSLKNSTAIDPIHTIAGVFDLEDSVYSFALGKYELLYFQDETLLSQTTLKRFSFMPGMTFDSFFYPAFVQSGQPRPAIYFPGGLGVSLSSEVITSRSVDNKLELYRPALFRLLATKGCKELNHIESSHKTDLVFICSDELRIIPLDFK